MLLSELLNTIVNFDPYNVRANVKKWHFTKANIE